MKLKSLLKPLLVVGLLLTVFVGVLQIPNMYREYVRESVASRVFEIKGVKDGGGGTGFQLEAPSGNTYIVTNSHICELAKKDSDSLLVLRNKHWMKRRILEVDENSDLCLLEAWPNLAGLKLGDKVHVGEMVSSIGHPHLGPTTMTSGEVVDFTDTVIAHHLMPSGDKKLDKLLGISDEMSCDLPKNEITKKHFMLLGLIDLGEIPVCNVRETKAIQTNVTIFPGNSGSPLVDSSGNVVGVVFAADSNTNWGYAVNLSHLKHLLKDF